FSAKGAAQVRWSRLSKLSKKPWAPEPRACTIRSGIRSWSKWVIFSRRMKSLSCAGPMTHALREDWWTAISSSWYVASGPWGGGARSLSRDPSWYLPSLTGPAPRVLALLLVSLSVLAAASSSKTGDTEPAGGAPGAEYSLDLVSLYGRLPATLPTTFACFSAGISV